MTGRVSLSPVPHEIVEDEDESWATEDKSVASEISAMPPPTKSVMLLAMPHAVTKLTPLEIVQCQKLYASAKGTIVSVERLQHILQVCLRHPISAYQGVGEVGKREN